MAITWTAVALAVSAGRAASVDLTLYNTEMLLDSDGATPLQGNGSSGDLVQLLRVGPNAVIDAPSFDGAPGGDDSLVAAANNPTHVGAGLLVANNGKLVQSGMLYDTTNVGAQVYVRFWNASTATQASHYGNSGITPLPAADGFGQAELDFAPSTNAARTAGSGLSLNDWLFNDPAGTDVWAAVNSGIDPVNDTFNSAMTDTSIDTDGAGRLVNTDTSSRFRFASVTLVTNGTTYLQWDISAWDQSDNDGGTMRVQFRTASDTGSVAGLVLTQLGGMRLRYRNGTNDYTIAEVPTNSTAGASMILGVNLDDDTLDVWYSIGGSAYIEAFSSVSLQIPGQSIGGIRVESEGNVGGGAGDYISTDRILHSRNPEGTNLFTVPTLAGWGLILLAALIAFLGARRLTRIPAMAPADA